MTPTQLQRLADKLSRLGFQLDDDVARLRKAGRTQGAERLQHARDLLQQAWLDVANAAEEDAQ
jgi:hypothetical protein